MGLSLDTRSTSERKFTFDSNDPAFHKTVWEGQGFSFTCIPLTREEMLEVLVVGDDVPAEKVGFTQDFRYFNRSIVSWDGLLDENDEPIPCDERHKLILFNVHHGFARRVMTAIKNRELGVKAKDEDTKKK